MPSLRLRLQIEYGGETRVVETEALAAPSTASGGFAMLGARVVWENATRVLAGAPPFAKVSAESLDFDRDGTPDFQESLPAFLEGSAAADLISALELSSLITDSGLVCTLRAPGPLRTSGLWSFVARHDSGLEVTLTQAKEGLQAQTGLADLRAATPQRRGWACVAWLLGKDAVQTGFELPETPENTGFVAAYAAAGDACLDPANVQSGTTYRCPDGSTQTGTLSLPAADQVQSGITFGPSSGITGTLTGTPVNCTVDGEQNCVARAGTNFKAADTSALAAKVKMGQSVAGVAGTYSPDFPDAANVRSIDTTNGVTGTYTPDFPDAANVRSSDTVNGVAGTLGDCTVDGEEGCVVPLATAIKAADTTSLTEWDIRRKRGPDGSVITFAGLEGRSKNCRNRANLTVGSDVTNSNDAVLPYNNTAFPASGSLVPDFFDTIDDYNDNLTGLPPDIVPWTVPGTTGTHGSSFTCGGIYATGVKNYSAASPTPTGADASLNHDPNGNWQDLTPGSIPGNTSSSNPLPGCNAADKFCVFRELISGLMVTEVSANDYDWGGALSYCHKLGEAGGAITSPIPTLELGLGTAHSDWRLPTQKELTHLSVAGIRGLNQTSALVGFFGDLDNSFWSASSSSTDSSNAWHVLVYDGVVNRVPKSGTYRVICVR